MRDDHVRVQWNRIPQPVCISWCVLKGPGALTVTAVTAVRAVAVGRRIRRPKNFEGRLGPVGSGEANRGCFVLQKDDGGEGCGGIFLDEFDASLPFFLPSVLEVRVDGHVMIPFTI